MHRILSQSRAAIWRLRLLKCRNRLCSSTEKFSKALKASEVQEYREFNTSNVSVASMAQNQTQPDMTIGRTESISILNPSTTQESVEEIDLTEQKTAPQSVRTAKTTMAFEEIPGPAILKLWEKYWKYVPLLGTQLVSSLLINKVILGRLSWNRNITPMKYLFNEYGSIVRINGPLAGDIVMIHRPEHIAEVFKEESNTPIRSGIDILEHYRLNYRKYRIAGPFSLQGAEWMELRAKVDKPFSQIVSDSFEKFETVCDEFCSKIRRIRNRQDEVPANFQQELIRWSMECFFVMTFNKRFGFLEPAGSSTTSEPGRLIDALTTANKYMSRCETGFQVWRFFETPFSRKLFSACDVIDGLIGKHIREAQNEIRNQLSHVDEHADAESSSPFLKKLLLDPNIHPDDIATLLMDIIVLGVQAVANCEAFLLYFLAKNPRVQKKLYDEIVSVTPNSQSHLTIDDLKNLPYLKACLQESLRLRPAFPYITRLLTRTVTIHGYTVPKGTYVIMATQITSQREENFEDPEKFRPERWLSSKNLDNCSQEYSCLPFGHGIRSCLGRNVAETQMMMLTSKLVREFCIEYDYADIKSSFSMVNVPNRALRFRFVDRD